MTRHQLTKEQIKAIADRAEGKEPDYELRTFVCRQCNHEIIVNPKYPKWETPTICTPCLEQMDSIKQEKLTKEIAAKIDPTQAFDLMKEINKFFELAKEIEEKKRD